MQDNRRRNCSTTMLVEQVGDSEPVARTTAAKSIVKLYMIVEAAAVVRAR